MQNSSTNNIGDERQQDRQINIIVQNSSTNNLSENNSNQNNNANARKNPGLAFILAFLFGPLGLLYADSGCAAISFFLISCVILLLSFIPVLGLMVFPILIVIWIVSIIWALKACK